VCFVNINQRNIDRLMTSMGRTVMTSVPGSEDETQLHRVLTLTHQRDWCMERLSQLSLDGRMDEARAITAEHLELLETLDARRSLWVQITREGC
jgi:hypothetical protein